MSTEPARRTSLVPAAMAEATAVNGGKSRRSGQALGLPTQRDRLIAAMGELIAELGPSAVGVHHVCQRAGMSRRTFYELYADRDACFLEVVGEAQDRLVAHVADAVAEAGTAWEDRAVAATRTVIGVLCADRTLGYLCVVAPLSGGGEALALRRSAIDRIGELLGAPPEVDVPTSMALTAAIGGVWEMLRRQLSGEIAESALAAPAIYALLAPFVGRRRAAARASLPGDAVAFVTRWTPNMPEADGDGLMVTELTRQTLAYLGTHPGAANIAIARAVDVRHESQMSRHLGRLERAGIVERRKEGRSNAWRLTDRGRDAASAVRAAGRRDALPAVHEA